MKPSIPSHKLLALIKNNNVTILDIRDKEEFDCGHIFGACHIPVDEISRRHPELPESKIIVTYCGKGGGRSERAANILNENGKKSLWLEGGYFEWSLVSRNSTLDEESMIFHQLFENESSSYTYLLADPATREAGCSCGGF